ncbi:hypothetical protein [Natronobacterium texcoconense]|uniref:Uncharacterized protein n=1 Tax=Natronobacterium texcoconense TaxID=1095778 RepID=A0A1H1AKK5_NATTX|nr:hypothetical protein [Natronobacterium texcoconense]SDQ40209.1 hypothetical protein SAMN04489842_0725 [Natronobacterium texcoconense]
MDRRKNRRAFVAATATALLAGCNELLEDETAETRDNGYNDEETSPDYELDFSLSDSTIDLSDLSTNSLGQMNEDDLEYFQLEDLELYEDGEPVDEVDSLELHLENEYDSRTVELGSELGTYEVACNQILDGRQEGTVKAEKDGETVADEARSIVKEVPETYRAQIIVDGQNFDDYETPFSFDNVEFTEEEYQELRDQHIRNETIDEIVRETVRNDEVDFHPEFDPVDLGYLYSHEEDEWQTNRFEDLDVGDLEDIKNDTGVAYSMHFSHQNDGRSGISGTMDQKTATGITLVDRHINDIPEGENRYEHDREIDLEGGYVGGSGHGNALYFERNTGQWINYDPGGGAVTEPANAPDAGRGDRYYAPADHEVGEVDEMANYSRKKQAGTIALYSTTRIPDVNSTDIEVSDPLQQTHLQRIENNQPLDAEFETALKAGMIHAHKTGKKAVLYGNNENRLLITENNEHFDQFRENSDPVTTEEVESQMLG